MRKNLWVGAIAAMMMMGCTGCAGTAMANSLSNNLSESITLVQMGSGAGFVEIDGKICYVNEAGEIQTDWVQMENGDWYYFDRETGELQVNTYSHDGYWVGEDGVWDGEEAIQGPAVAAAEKAREERRNENTESDEETESIECEPLPEVERKEDDIEEMVKFPWEREEAEETEQEVEETEPAPEETELEKPAPGELEPPIVPEHPPVEEEAPDTEGDSGADFDEDTEINPEPEIECEPLPEVERKEDDIEEMVKFPWEREETEETEQEVEETEPAPEETEQEKPARGELEPPIVPEHPPVEEEAPDTEGDSGADFDEELEEQF